VRNITTEVKRYGRAREIPPPGSSCPICKHNDCFGRMPGEGDRWACHSSGHPPDMGQRGEGCVWGDLLDLDLALAGIAPTTRSRVERLRAEGYLVSPLDKWKSRGRRRSRPVASIGVMHKVCWPPSSTSEFVDASAPEARPELPAPQVERVQPDRCIPCPCDSCAMSPEGVELLRLARERIDARRAGGEVLS